ncbi:hypothetical protein QA584_03085 [Anaerocolumna sp. AGMB13025]|uniref:hypothetical protein n=1 Tax=Anaerocolumna sp. AGMB13025 TaxID=3039116 RepID=UPI00241BF7C8|nr:hypothetical protein [Anaerocolumna sp. AGMB13025]WFR58062.1 hypothetical protein QA584_03085 [Anaerocolumna sp. AGMB13025]
MKNKINIKNITTIGVGIAAIIGGGMVIYQISHIFPLPGVKFIMMSPYLSAAIFIILNKIKSHNGIMWLGGVFGGLMSLMSIYMGIAIILTTLTTHIAMCLLKNRPHEQRIYIGSILFSALAGGISLLVSKTLIGGVFAEIGMIWVLIITMLSAAFGWVGVRFGKRITKYIPNNL